MRDHVRILGILNIVFGALIILIGLASLLFFGGVAALVVWVADASDANVAVPVLGVIGAVIFVVLLLVSLPSIIAGVGLLKYQPWARVLTIILSALNLMNVPIGTALGVYGLWVLLNGEAERLFATREA
jgi:hypothetical protein